MYIVDDLATEQARHCTYNGINCLALGQIYDNMIDNMEMTMGTEQ